MPATSVNTEPLLHEKPENRGKYSLLRAIRDAVDLRHGMPRRNARPAGFESEVSQDISARSGRQARGFFVPINSPLQARAVTTTTGAGAITSQVAPTFADALRGNMIAAKLGAQFVDLGAGDGGAKIPRVKTGAAPKWIAEGAAPSAGEAVEIDQISLTPKTVTAFVDLTRKMINSGTVEFEANVIADIATALAVEVDRVTFAGTGANNEPTGLLATVGIPVKALGANGLAITRADVLAIEAAVGNANADAGASVSLGWAGSPNARQAMRTIEVSTGGGRFLWGDDGRILEYPAVASTHLPSNLAKGSGTGLSALVYGNFADLLVNAFGAIDVLIDAYTFSPSGTARITVFLDVDVAVKHVESFMAVKDLKTS